MSTADAIVRNDEVVGSIPTSSTIFSVTYRPCYHNHVPFRSKTSLTWPSRARLYPPFFVCAERRWHRRRLSHPWPLSSGIPNHHCRSVHPLLGNHCVHLPISAPPIR